MEARSQQQGEAKDPKMKKKKAKAAKLDNVIVQECEDILAKVELTNARLAITMAKNSVS